MATPVEAGAVSKKDRSQGLASLAYVSLVQSLGLFSKHKSGWCDALERTHWRENSDRYIGLRREMRKEGVTELKLRRTSSQFLIPSFICIHLHKIYLR